MANTTLAKNTAMAPQSIDRKLIHCDESLTLRCLENTTKIHIRTGVDDKKLRSIIESKLDLALPRLGEAVTSTSLSILSTSPDEWLAITTTENHQPLLNVLELEVKNGHFLSCFDASSATVCFQLDGQAATQIFSVLTEANLNPDKFHVNACKCIRFAQCSTIVHRTNIKLYNLYIPRSYASWVWNRIQTVT